MKTLLSAVVAATLALVVLEAGAEQAAGERQVALRIESTSLADALDAWAQQSGYQIFVQWGATRNLTAPTLKGTFTAQAALEQLLEGTSLTYVWISQKAVSIRRKVPQTVPAALERTGLEGTQALPVAKFSGDASGISPSTSALGGDSQRPELKGTPLDERVRQQLEEIIVTGTHIRGVSANASPTLVFGRDEIDLSGAGSVQEFSRRLPQNLADVSEGTMGGLVGVSQTQNAVSGGGINLRGLGSDATLVLMNGRRLAPGNHLANFVDVSLIPLTALDRVEIVPDGASAIYGSDAVGGVVNFILRQDFEGAETRARYATVNSGGRSELTVGQTFGLAGSVGSLLASYEFSEYAALNAADRSFSQGALQPFTLLPDQERHAGILNARYDISPSSGLFFDGTFAHRKTHFDTSNQFFSHRTSADIDAFSVAAGADATFESDSRLTASYSFSSSRTNLQTEDLQLSLLASNHRSTAETSTIDLGLDGTLGKLFAGPVRYAVGAQHRRESLRHINFLAGSDIDPSREIIAGYGELRFPLIGPLGGSSADRLQLTLADRYEEYDDFGSTNNPHIGVRWQAVPSLAVRGTYGTSFTAPLLNDLNPALEFAVPVPNEDPRTGGVTNILLVAGGNSSLRPQEATSWTTGLDWTPDFIPSLQVSLTYFRIDFDNRITNPSAEIDTFGALQDEDRLGPEIIQRNPPASLVQRFASDPAFVNPLEIDLSTIGVLVDSRVQNLSEVKTKGVDLSLSSDVNTRFGTIAFGLTSTYLLSFDTKFSSGSPSVETRNTAYNPVDLRARAQSTLTRGALTVGVFANYVDSYTDVRGATPVPISSWTTFDLTAGLSFRNDSDGLLRGAYASISITNVADRDPPFVNNTFVPVYFDGTNASALGRFYSLQLGKQF
jgi:iron complex outermembrane recepter protein